jgi:Protein of unknown function (DUF1564)
MILFRNREPFPTPDLSEKSKSASTLLIPAHLYNAFLEKRKLFENKSCLYFQYLLHSYRTLSHSGVLPNPQKITTEYQESDLDLKRVSFRPFNEDWIELGCLSLTFGKSRCALFVFLLELDLAGFTEILSQCHVVDVVPTSDRLLLRASWTLQRGLDTFTRSYYTRI